MTRAPRSLRVSIDPRRVIKVPSRVGAMISARARRPLESMARARQSRQLEYAAQDLTDLLSYGGLDEHPDHVEMDGKFVRGLFISGYPLVASSGWLDSLINFNHDIDISYQFHPVEAVIALPKLRKKITELESTRRAMITAGRIVGSEVLDPLDSAVLLRDRIARGEEKLFQLSITVTIRADSLEELESSTRLLQTELASRLFYTKYARYRQLDAIESVLPRADDVLSQKRNLDTSSLALTFPLVSSELVHENGILYGINTTNNSLVILDRFSLHNANSITFAQSGSGKSYMSKVEILRQLMSGTQVIVIDPEREYQELAHSVSGSYVHIGLRSKDKINPFDISVGEASDINEHIQNLSEVVSVLVDGLSKKERAVVDKAIVKTFKSTKGMPLLKDLYRTLHAYKDETISERLEKYVSGSLSNVFNAHSNVSFDNRLIVFDIKDLSESLRKVMMLIITNFVQARVQQNPSRRLLVIDEGWLLLQRDESARVIAGLVRRARKYYLGVSLITQQAEDFLKNEYGRAIASQSSLRILMRQDTTTIKGVTSEFDLSEYERQFLSRCDKGEAIMIADEHHVAVKVVASEQEHPLITTMPQELYRT